MLVYNTQLVGVAILLFWNTVKLETLAKGNFGESSLKSFDEIIEKVVVRVH